MHVDLKTLQHWPPAKVKAWLDGVTIGEPVNGESFDWYYLALTAEILGGNGQSLEWAEICVRVFEALAPRMSDLDVSTCIRRAAWMRADSIRDFGAREGHPLLDPEFLFMHFQDVATMSSAQARQMLDAGSQVIPRQTLWNLVLIKNLLIMMHGLAHTGLLQKHPELEEWYRTFPGCRDEKA